MYDTGSRSYSPDGSSGTEQELLFRAPQDIHHLIGRSVAGDSMRASGLQHARRYSGRLRNCGLASAIS